MSGLVKGRGQGQGRRGRGRGLGGGPAAGTPCRFYQSGHCSRGSSCRYSHSGPVSAAEVSGDAAAIMAAAEALVAGVSPPAREISVDWAAGDCPTTADEHAATAVLVRRGEFAEALSEARSAEVTAALGSGEIGLSLEQGMLLRLALLQEKAVATSSSARRAAASLLADYEAGAGILELAARTDHPPLNVLRIIFGKRGMSKQAVKQALKDPMAHLSERDAREAELAVASDCVAPANDSRAAGADRFEDEVCRHFADAGARFFREDELKSGGKLPPKSPTPDLFLLDAVTVGGERVKWIDAKDMYGAATAGFQRQKMAQQVARYVRVFGPGAVVFSKGFCADLELPGATLLDFRMRS